MISLRIGGKHVCIKKEIIIPIFMLVFVVSYYIQAHDLSPKSLAFPSVFLIILTVSSVYAAVKSVAIVTPEIEAAEKKPLLTKKVLYYLCTLTLFIISLPYLGIYITIPAFLIITMLLLRVRDIKTLIIIPAGVTVLIHLLFVVLLSTRLPSGPF